MQASPHRPLFLGFSSQKGGVGKSTLAEILSSMLYYEEGISLFVVDCDLTQDSFFKLREREKETIGEDASLTTYMQGYSFSNSVASPTASSRHRPKKQLAKRKPSLRSILKKPTSLLSLTSLVMQEQESYWNSPWRWTISFLL